MVIDLMSKTIIPRIKTHYFTKYSNVSYKTEFNDEIKDALNRLIVPIFCENKVHIDYMQRIIGSFLTCENRQRSVYMWLGKGRNAKSVLIDLLKLILSSFHTLLNKQVIAASSNSIRYESANSHTAAYVNIKGARLLEINKLAKSDKLITDFIKSVGNNNRISSRGCHDKKTEEFKIIGKLIITTNNRPSFNFNDTTISDCFIFCPFNARFLSSEVINRDYNGRTSVGIYLEDNSLIDNFKNNQEYLDCFFSWIVEGAHKYLTEEIITPPDFTKFKQLKSLDIDYIGKFLDAFLIKESGRSSDLLSIHSRYLTWAKNQSDCNLKQYNSFCKDLHKRFPKQFSKKDGHSVLINYYLGNEL
jgi:putative DNA primase/helicase